MNIEPTLTVLVGGQEPAGDSFLAHHIVGALWCADAGYRHAYAMGLVPQRVVGDLDSLNQAQLDELARVNCMVDRYPPEKDESDLELTLRLAAEAGHRSVRLLASGGGRLDHSLFNFVPMFAIADRLGLRLEALSSQWTVTQISTRFPQLALQQRQGWGLSLMPLSPMVESVDLIGMRYSLDGAQLRFDATLGLSNKILSEDAQARIGTGLALVILIPPQTLLEDNPS